ncbi:hypothetical protein [Gimesia aquarii]|uniref:GYF domain-containing protein n=1 Tax=Gimesia aquarii TaxID=2527964 RepID=A0A517WWI1_9PLAN|nr:hypothetical protein [Gimesia aquarii]QDU09633.1 hypothetical protein V202x_30090 [Gimesia aquarii]
MTEYPVPENREATEWRYDDQGLLAGPYSYNELMEYVELDYIQPGTKIIHEDGRNYQAFEIGLFPGFVPEKTDPVEEYRNAVMPLPGWNFLAGVVAVLVWVSILVQRWIPADHWIRDMKPYAILIGGFAVVLMGCFALLTGTAHDTRGNPEHRPVANRIAGLIVIAIGVSILCGEVNFLLFRK